MMNANLSLERLYKSTPIIDAPEPGSFVRGEGDTKGASFSEVASAVGRSALETLGKAETTAISGLSGSADPHAVVEALAAAELALETAVSVRDKAVEAYQEILRMPV